MTPMTLNLLTGICLAVAGFALGLRQILLSPNLSTFPCAPREVRVAMFIMAVGLAWLAVRFFGADVHDTEPWAGPSAVAVAVLSGVIALYNVVLMVNVLAHRLPPGVWPRLERIEAHARAPKNVPHL
jgi:RsiW-degrading membrane proteinase PrsW (M82 family)